jgi:hypothetical protein
MARSLAGLLTLALVGMGGSYAAEEPAQSPLVVADRLYYAGPEGNLGLSFLVKFVSLASLADHLRPDRPIGNFKNREWRLYDVLVSADCNGNGYVAEWKVSGPSPLLLEYQRNLEADRDRNIFVDFSSQVLDFKPTAHWETSSSRGQGDPIDVVLSSDRQLYQLGATVLLQVEIRNNTGKAVRLVMPQDGSDRAWRYPLGFFDLKDQQGRKDVLPLVPRCKTTDPLAPDSFFTLDPGRSRNLYDKGHPLNLVYQLTKPGVYFIGYRYSTVAGKDWQWYGAYSDEYWDQRQTNEFWKKREQMIAENRRRLAEVERFSTRSNWIQVEITDRLVSQEEALRIAEDICRKENWPWQDVAIADRDLFWEVVTKRATLGGNAFVRIDKKSGRVLEKHLTGP